MMFSNRTLRTKKSAELLSDNYTTVYIYYVCSNNKVAK